MSIITKPARRRPEDPDRIAAHVAQLKARRQVLEVERADARVDLASNPSDEALMATIAAHSAKLAGIDAALVELDEAGKESSRRATDADLAAQRAQGAAAVEAAAELMAGPVVDIAGQIDVALANLRDLVEGYVATTGRAAHTARVGLEDIGVHLPAHSSVATYAKVKHATLQELIEFLNTRELRELKCQPLAKVTATRFAAALDRAMAREFA